MRAVVFEGGVPRPSEWGAGVGGTADAIQPELDLRRSTGAGTHGVGAACGGTDAGCGERDCGTGRQHGKRSGPAANGKVASIINRDAILSGGGGREGGADCDEDRRTVHFPDVLEGSRAARGDGEGGALSVHDGLIHEVGGDRGCGGTKSEAEGFAKSVVVRFEVGSGVLAEPLRLKCGKSIDGSHPGNRGDAIV